jgi:hypothetical protein
MFDFSETTKSMSIAVAEKPEDRAEIQNKRADLRLLDYAVNIYSQHGEDGILSKMLELLPTKNRWCVEFGAWDGQFLSNTCNLIETNGYSAVLIEAKKERFAGLLKRHQNNPNVFGLNRLVGWTGDDDLDHILADFPIPADFDFLSIDIEGNDYHVWKAISIYSPKIVCVAYNPSIPTEVDFFQPADGSIKQGSSLLAFTRLGRQKGYELVCVNHNTAFFVQSKYFPLFGISDNDPRALREDVVEITYLFTGFDGKIFLRGREELLNHRGIRILKRIRQLPRIFQAYPPDYRPVIRFLYKFYWRGARLLGRA